jgi:hypothetical protein
MAKLDQRAELLEQFTKLHKEGYRDRLSAFDTFLPPRLVKSLRQETCVPFFGAGVSASAGIPVWWDLLSSLGFTADFADEPDLDADPLTAAEVLAHQIGLPDLQHGLVEALKRAHDPTLAHFLLASLDQNVYITTNYDCLFENAWEAMYNVAPRVITTNADLRAFDADDLGKRDGAPLLFKLHGSADREGEELILTRGQYRRHYRSNRDMFNTVRGLLGHSNTLFLGFGHRDPEITRLVEDVIHGYELRTEPESEVRPAFYSLQFDMRERTPEIFAARGIVALRPPVRIPPGDVDPRTLALASSMIEMLAAMDSEQHARLDLDRDLDLCLARLRQEVGGKLAVLEELAGSCGPGKVPDADTLQRFGEQLAAVAQQGLYVLNARGDVNAQWLPATLTHADRHAKTFARRPYVRQAQMYRAAFASASYGSVFNGNATVFMCAPIVGEHSEYKGLVFSAFHPGAWGLLEELADEVRSGHEETDVSVLLVDSNGVVLIPPNGEFAARSVEVGTERPDDNRGYEYERMRRLSRRDKLVERIWNNIVPLSQDDDAFRAGDVQFYSVVAEVPHTRWKLALSIPYPSK